LHRQQPGFTLVELSIVLLIVAILLAGVLMPLSMQMELRRYADTKKTMDQINEALFGFALMNGRLPCPADRTIADGTANAGVERAACNTAATQVGVIPWVTLNIPETDEWGGRFTYRVSSIFDQPIAGASYACAPPVYPTQASFALCASGDMQVESRTTGKVIHYLTNATVPAVFISHGKNGYGAYGPQGTVVHSVTNGTNEYTNANPATTFISREKTDASSPCNDTPGSSGPMCEFDDLVAWIPLTTLMNRMVVSGKLP